MIRQAHKPATEKTLTAAAAYVRMSGRTQDKSPAEQRAEIIKLANREGFTIAQWFTDEAISGDSGTEDRAGLAALLTAAKAGASGWFCYGTRTDSADKTRWTASSFTTCYARPAWACGPVARAQSTSKTSPSSCFFSSARRPATIT